MKISRFSAINSLKNCSFNFSNVSITKVCLQYGTISRSLQWFDNFHFSRSPSGFDSFNLIYLNKVVDSSS